MKRFNIFPKVQENSFLDKYKKFLNFFGYYKKLFAFGKFVFFRKLFHFLLCVCGRGEGGGAVGVGLCDCLSFLSNGREKRFCLKSCFKQKIIFGQKFGVGQVSGPVESISHYCSNIKNMQITSKCSNNNVERF